MRNEVHLYKYHEGADRDGFCHDIYTIEADDDSDAVRQADRLIKDYPKTEHARIYDANGFPQLEIWVEEGAAWEAVNVW
jgi:hypothetical protein